jgi:hypothetical protein
MRKIGAVAWFLAYACPPSVGGGDGNFQSLPSIRSLFHHHFPTRDFIILIGLSHIVDDYFLAFALIGHAGPN